VRRVIVVLMPCLLALGVGVLAFGEHSDGREPAHSAKRQPPPRLLLGGRGTELNRDSEPSGRAEAFPFRAGATGVTRSLGVYVDGPTVAKQLRVAIYTDRRQAPWKLLASGARRSPARGTWNVLGTKPTRLYRGRTYWLAVLGTGGRLAYRDRAGGPCHSQESAQTGLDLLPATWRSGPRWQTCPLSAAASPASVAQLRSLLPPEPSRVPVKSAGPRGCISHPGGCGFPDASNTGVPASTHLVPRSGVMRVTSAGAVISGVALNGSIEVNANDVTIENSDITVDGTQGGCNSPCGGRGIWVAPGATGTVIHDVTCHGGAATGANVTEFCVLNNNDSTQVSRVHFYNCTTCMAGPGSWSDNFVDQTEAVIPQEHYEDLYYGGGAGSLVVNHNTMLNPQGQTAVVFLSVDFGDQTAVAITNNLVAGGGYMVYGGRSGNGGSVIGPVTVTGNRFSQRYYRNGGFYGVAAYFDTSVTSWSNNIWDDSLKTVARPSG
jgi:hypothetical protein